MNLSAVPGSLHARADERHDGVDVCPMCMTEILHVTNQCPHCGAAVDSDGIYDKADSPSNPMHQTWREMACARAVLLASLMQLPNHWFKAANQPLRWLYIVGIIILVAIALRKTLTWRLAKGRDVKA